MDKPEEKQDAIESAVKDSIEYLREYIGSNGLVFYEDILKHMFIVIDNLYEEGKTMRSEIKRLKKTCKSCTCGGAKVSIFGDDEISIFGDDSPPSLF
jgi:hypothetical protein